MEFSIWAGMLLVSLGLLLPAVRSAWIRRQCQRARADLVQIADAVRAFVRDTGVAPSRSAEGGEATLYRLAGPGNVAPASYYQLDGKQGALEDHLLRSGPPGAGSPYPGWRGPYLQSVAPDPWNSAYVVVLYPLYLEDDRDCIVVSAGPNRRMDGSYASPRDSIPWGDDLIEVIVDKSEEQRAPIVPAG